jgi:predicted amidohydrolase YtcJ
MAVAAQRSPNLLAFGVELGQRVDLLQRTQVLRHLAGESRRDDASRGVADRFEAGQATLPVELPQSLRVELVDAGCCVAEGTYLVGLGSIPLEEVSDATEGLGLFHPSDAIGAGRPGAPARRPRARQTGVVRVDALLRGRFVTFDAAHPEASQLAVLDGRIVAVDEDCAGLAASVIEQFPEGSIGFPGFHDAHCHTAAYGMSLREVRLSSPPLTSLDDLYAAIADRAARSGAGEWVVGSGYDQNKLGGTHPDRRALDRASGGRPVLLKHTSGHMSFVNSAALALIGDEALACRLEGGQVARDEHGEATGLLEEKAQALAQGLRPPPSVQELAAAIAAAHERYLAEGLTSACEAGVAGGWVGQSPLELGAYQAARDQGRLRVRTTAMIASDLLHEMGATGDAAVSLALDAGLRTGIGDEWLRVGALKVFSDGSLIGRTCWMHAGFSDDEANTGYPQADPADLRATIVAAHNAGWQIATHAIGDKAVDFALDCYEEALRGQPRPDHRHRIEHCGLCSDSSLRRLATLGVIPVPQGRFVGEIGDGMATALGPHRMKDAYRLRSFLDAGLALPGSSDRPVVEGRPLLGIQDMVRRLTQSGAEFAVEEALTVEEAMRAYSLGSAYATRSEHERGRLIRGHLADVVVLGDDPRRELPSSIADIPVRATVVGGEVRFRAT